MTSRTTPIRPANGCRGGGRRLFLGLQVDPRCRDDSSPRANAMALPDALTAVAAALVLRVWARPATDPAANAAEAARANRADQRTRALHKAHSAQKGGACDS